MEIYPALLPLAVSRPEGWVGMGGGWRLGDREMEGAGERLSALKKALCRASEGEQERQSGDDPGET